MSSGLGGLAPELVWRRFLELTRIPRPPRGEGRARDHVLAWARERGFATDVDAAGTRTTTLPASTGRGRAPTVVLQAHLDMVCERDPASPYDPREGRIHVLRDGDWVLADGTTLGADDGIGVAAALAAAEDEQVVHGPLELLFTVCEEEGLVGAKALDPELVSGGLLVNLDGTSDGAITVGCAGSAHTFVRLRLPLVPLDEDRRAFRIRLSGGRGGHSGADIARGRANAIAALGSILGAGHASVPIGLVRLEGGVSRNAIPREAEAVVAVPTAELGAWQDAAKHELEELWARHAEAGDELTLAFEHVDAETATGPETTERALTLLAAVPLGVVALSTDVPDAVEASTSLNVARTDGDVLVLASMTRSASEATLEATVEEIEQVAKRHGAETETTRSYPPWTPDLDSALLAAAERTYRDVLGTNPRREVVHGGLECAVLGGRLPGVEMIAIGPTVVGPHAPGERLSITGTQRFYRLLGGLLDDLSGSG